MMREVVTILPGEANNQVKGLLVEEMQQGWCGGSESFDFVSEALRWPRSCGLRKNNP